MSRTNRVFLASLALVALLGGLAVAVAPPPRPAIVAAATYRVSGPFTHENLTVFFLHGEDQIKDKKILTLDEALKAKKVIVHETKNVNQLLIENVSNEEVFIQAGDIVKGGQQDRVLAIDMLLPPSSGKVPVPVFCVESGRWERRGGENVKAFSRSAYCLAGNELKLAARKDMSQRQVWKTVTVVQKNLSKTLKVQVMSPQSATSLQLTLEHKKVKEAVEATIKSLEKELSDKDKDVIGYAVAVNGKVTSADVYANADLFRKLWPKLLQATATEAVALKKEKEKVPAVEATAVNTFLAEVAKGKQTEKKLGKELREVQQETKKNILFETQVGDKKAVLRRCYLAK